MVKLGAEFVLGGDPTSSAIRFSFERRPAAGVADVQRRARPLRRTCCSTPPPRPASTCASGRPCSASTGWPTATSHHHAGDVDLTARVLIDASGQGAVVGRHLGTRRTLPDGKVAHFAHFDGVERLPGEATGHPTIVWCDEGWFWLIGLTEAKTSVGFVARPDLAGRAGVPADQLLRWAIDRCPVVRDRMRDATGPADNARRRRLQLHLPAVRRPRLLPGRRRGLLPGPDLLDRA